LRREMAALCWWHGSQTGSRHWGNEMESLIDKLKELTTDASSVSEIRSCRAALQALSFAEVKLVSESLGYRNHPATKKASIDLTLSRIESLHMNRLRAVMIAG
jgi:hypothetical protein